MCTLPAHWLCQSISYRHGIAASGSNGCTSKQCMRCPSGAPVQCHEPGHVHAGLGELYLAAVDAVHAVAPQTRFYLEGAGQSGLGCNWGDG